MIAGLLLSVAVLGDSTLYSGIRQQLQVMIPRIDTRMVVDGILDEAVWKTAARLIDFSQYSPSDGRVADEATEVLVWYSPTALHIGARVHAAPGTVRAHLADRDAGIIPDDYVEFQLGTFNDGRQAFVFAVNPLGVQADGALVEGSQTRRRANDADQGGGREQADLSPDYAFDSKGRLTDDGYELELRIPFRSLRYQSAKKQTWSFQVIRKSAASGREDTWAPARRAASSFIGQAGSLVGLSDLQRGLVLEANPIVTSSVVGSELAAGGFDRLGGRPVFGGNVRWGITTNLSLNGTVKPDFSQVESDAGQITADPRSALFFQEKRPFFLDGIEYFATPGQVIYTRRIATPIAATKLTGKVSGTSVALLSAVDGTAASFDGFHNPVYNLLRVQRDIGPQSRLGLAYTDKVEGDRSNRVAEVDGRFLFGKIYSLALNGAVSRTRGADSVTTGPSWSIGLNRAGRLFGFQLTFKGLSEGFQAQSGFVGRGNIADFQFQPSITLYGKQGGFLERFIGRLNHDYTWVYRDFTSGRASQDRKFHIQTSWVLRGGWSLGVSALIESFGFDPGLYVDYALERRVGSVVDTIPFTGTPRLRNFDWLVRVASPNVAGFQLNSFLIAGKDENFFEWSSGTIWYGQLGLTYKPTNKLRFDGSMPIQIYTRRTDGTEAGRSLIPRLKVEYQVSRAVFVRLVGQYRHDRRDALRDDSRTEYPILIRNSAGLYVLTRKQDHNTFRLDALFSYQPTPGTVFFAGFGQTSTELEGFRFRGLRRQSDGFFTKLSYLFRL